MKLLSILLGLTCLSQISWSAIETKIETKIETNINQRFQTYHMRALNHKYPMEQRWQAVFAAAQVANKNDLVKIKHYTLQPEWFMRNAALLALDKVDQVMAEDAAKKLLSDKALVVRSAAVDVLSGSALVKNRNLLAQELDKPYNFNKKVSLWIRPQIMEKLAAVATPQQKKFFANYLFDQDPQVVQYSMNALEHITGITYPGTQRLSSWRSYAKSKRLVN